MDLHVRHVSGDTPAQRVFSAATAHDEDAAAQVTHDPAADRAATAARMASRSASASEAGSSAKMI